MKILFVTAHFPPSLGGVENYVFNIALGLKQTDTIEVVVVTSDANAKKQRIEDYFGIKVYRLPVMIRVSNTPINPLWYFSLKRIIREEKPDIINSHQPLMFIGDMAAFLTGNIPFVLTYHTGTMKKHRFPIDIMIYLYEKFVLPLTAKKARKIICASNFVRNTILKKYAFKSTIIHPGVDLSLFKPNPAIQKDNNLILFICRYKNMQKMKGLYYLLDAIKDFYGIKLHVIGEKEIFTDKRIVSVGIKQGKELVEEMQKASVVVLPSLAEFESYGMVLTEAMACQTPVIGTNMGGIPEVIREGIDGFIVPTNDSNALGLAILKILENKELATCMGHAGAAKVREQLTWDTRVALTQEVFESCLK
jgi:glycosyltransferase involved in cell wall biosynthesis